MSKAFNNQAFNNHVFKHRVITMATGAVCIMLLATGLTACSKSGNTNTSSQSSSQTTTTDSNNAATNKADNSKADSTSPSASASQYAVDETEAAGIKQVLQSLQLEAQDVSLTAQELEQVALEHNGDTVYVTFTDHAVPSAATAEQAESFVTSVMRAFATLQSLQHAQLQNDAGTLLESPTYLTWINHNADGTLTSAFTFNHAALPSKGTAAGILAAAEAYTVAPVIQAPMSDLLPQATSGEVTDASGNVLKAA